MYSSRSIMRLIMMGFPIRKSPDQRLFAPPRSLSQLITSFIASMCLGILRTPLVALLKCLFWRWLGYINYYKNNVSYPISQFSKSKILWSLPGSNRWPPECKSGALPTELKPQFIWLQQKWACVDSNHGPLPYQGSALTTWATSPIIWSASESVNSISTVL